MIFNLCLLDLFQLHSIVHTYVVYSQPKSCLNWSYILDFFSGSLPFLSQKQRCSRWRKQIFTLREHHPFGRDSISSWKREAGGIVRLDLLCRDFSVSSLEGGLARKGKLLSRRKCLLENTGRDISSQPGSCEPGN